MTGRGSIAYVRTAVSAAIAALLVAVLAVGATTLRDDGPLGGYPDIHRRQR